MAHQVVIEGEGHTWPGGPQFLPAFLAGDATDAFGATTWLWEFFERVGRPGRPRSTPRASRDRGRSYRIDGRRFA